MTPNYYLEYRFIPGLIEEVKNERMPFQALIDIEWMKETLASNNVDICWEGFSIDILDSNYNKTSLENGKYIAYTFPTITITPEAKYGVIDIESKSYYTFESSWEGWVIGSQDMNTHSFIEEVKEELTLKEFIKTLQRPKISEEETPDGKWSYLRTLIFLAIATLLIFIIYKCNS